MLFKRWGCLLATTLILLKVKSNIFSPCLLRKWARITVGINKLIDNESYLPSPGEIIQESDVMLSSRGLRALGYKKCALCELSNGKPPVTTCKKEQRETLRSCRDYRPRRKSSLFLMERVRVLPQDVGAWLPIRTRPYGPAKACCCEEKKERRKENENGGAA